MDKEYKMHGSRHKTWKRTPVLIPVKSIDNLSPARNEKALVLKGDHVHMQSNLAPVISKCREKCAQYEAGNEMERSHPTEAEPRVGLELLRKRFFSRSLRDFCPLGGSRLMHQNKRVVQVVRAQDNENKNSSETC